VEQRTCKVEGCTDPGNLPGTARGMCGRHYYRWQTYGDPNAPVKKPRSPRGFTSKVKLTCITCGASFERYPSQAGLYCQRACRAGVPQAFVASSRTCDHCQGTFTPTSSRQRFCTTCVPDKHARTRLQRYGVSQPEWDEMVARFGGMCWVCVSLPATHLDHCHVTNKNRGAVCNRCNMVLHYVEKPGILERARSYLVDFGG
jgi:hypothetical protein